MKRFFQLAVVLFCSGSHFALAEEIVIFGNDANPPTYLENGQPKGILVEIMR
jgi:hypothetical protein